MVSITSNCITPIIKEHASMQTERGRGVEVKPVFRDLPTYKRVLEQKKQMIKVL